MNRIKGVPIADRIYKQNFHLCYGGKDEDMIAFLVKYHGEEVLKEIELLNGSKGASIHLSSGHHYIWVGRSKDIDAVLIHELLHFTLFVLRNCHVSYSEDNEETACYYMEYLYEEIMKKWKKLTKSKLK